MKNRLYLLFFLLVSVCMSGWSQGLLDELEESMIPEPKKEFTYATFKTTRIINGHSVESPNEGVMQFMISHRFGIIYTGFPDLFNDLFGLDNANIRFNLEYGLLDNLSIGVGRSSTPRSYDAFVKYKFLRQSKGEKSFPMTVSFLANAAIDARKWSDPNRENMPRHRMTYAYQILMARKFNDRISVQLMPTWVHRNLAPTADIGWGESNDIFAMGFAGRFMLSKRVGIMLEYYWMYAGKDHDLKRSAISIRNGTVYGNNDSYIRDTYGIGIDIETGGHVFQLHFTNSNRAFERGFALDNTNNILRGEIHLGFNITRVFTLFKPDLEKRAKKKAEKVQKKNA